MSKETLIVTGHVHGGKFVAANRDLFAQAFWSHENQEVDVVVKRHRKTRSLAQNAYYFGVVVKRIGDAMGESDLEAVHDMLKMELNYHLVKVGTRELRIPLSTASLSTEDFEDYLERARRWASEWLSLYIPLPHEVESAK